MMMKMKIDSDGGFDRDDVFWPFPVNCIGEDTQTSLVEEPNNMAVCRLVFTLANNQQYGRCDYVKYRANDNVYICLLAMYQIVDNKQSSRFLTFDIDVKRKCLYL